ncbi:MAG: glutamate synthase subunit alpha, partial [Phycisphaeraceae bacterium]
MPDASPAQHDTTRPTARLTAPKAQGLYDPANEHDNCGVGFIANVKGQRTHAIVEQALTMLSRMDHRGGCGCETNTGDGAGILTAIPNKLMRKAAQQDLSVDLPELGEYAVGNIFLPTEAKQYDFAKQTLEAALTGLDLKVLGWRTPPTEPTKADVGPTALKSMPVIEQLFVTCAPGTDNDDFERKLYLARNRAIN